MRAGIGGLVLSMMLVPSFAFANDVRDALDAVKDAIDQVRDEGGRCKKKTLDDLRDLEDELKDAVRSPKKRPLERARRTVKALEEDADVCPRKVGALLREARDAIDEALDALPSERSGGRGGREEAPARNPNVPYDDFGTDCKDTWFMHRFVKTTTNNAKDLELIEAMSAAACASAAPMAETRWPNGLTAKFSNGEWRYPNGLTAKFAEGELRYPSGLTAKFANGEWRYPNGLTAKFADGLWRYPNGQDAGDWRALLAWACQRLGKAECDAVNKEFDSTIPDWRDYALVEMAYRAK